MRGMWGQNDDDDDDEDDNRLRSWVLYTCMLSNDDIMNTCSDFHISSYRLATSRRHNVTTPLAS